MAGSGHGNRIRGAAVGGSLVGGWVLHDLVVMVTSAQPSLALRLLIGSLLLAVAGAHIGWLLAGTHRLLRYSLLIGVLGIAIAVTVLPGAVNPAHSGLAKSVLLLALAAAALAVAPARWGAAALPVGALLAVTAAVWGHLHWTAIMPGFLVLEATIAVAAGALLLATQLTHGRRRRLVLCTLVLVCACAVGARAGYSSRLRRADLPQPFPTTAASGPNLLLVVLDTVRADHLSAYGYHLPTTPGLERLLDEGFVRYSAARSTSSWTLPSHGSLFTGLLPSEHGATHVRSTDREAVELRWSWVNCLRDDVPTLAEILTGEGYRTGAVVANRVLSHSLGVDRGFSHYDDRGSAGLQCRFSLVQQLGWRPELSCLPYRDATTITDQALSWLGTGSEEQPFFLFVNYMDAHRPYFPPRPFDRTLVPERPTDPIKPTRAFKALQYDRELRYLDHELQRLLDGLRRSDRRWQDTVVIITSDHGEAFGEHGHWGHAQYLYEELIRVPLLVKGVGRCTGSEGVDVPISGEQVFALALCELGLGPEPQRPQGLHVVAEWYCSKELARTAVCHSQDLLAWLDEDTKYLAHADGRVEVYNLATDQRELQDLAAQAPGRERALGFSREHWDKPWVSSASPQLSPEMLRSLKALGYLQ